jgi:TRAP-type C4-dicarboxylate transport system substrate-binding protein
MKGSSLVLGCLALVFSTATQAQVSWNLPSAYAPDTFHTENLAAFAQQIAKETNGKLSIKLHPGGSLFKAPEIKRAVMTGQAQVGEFMASLHENEDPIFGIDGLPFLAPSYEQSRKLWGASREAIAVEGSGTAPNPAGLYS